MNRHSRFTAAILCIFFALTSACTISAYAENEQGGPDGGELSYVEPSDGGGGQQSIDDGGGQQSIDDGGGQQSIDDGGGQQSYDGGGGQQSIDDGGGAGGGGGQQSYDGGGGQQSYDGGGAGGNTGDASTYYDGDGNEHSNPDEVYVGGDQTYTPPASTPSTTAALYDTSKEKVYDKTLSSNDWKNIREKLNGSNASEVKNGVVDFSDMQAVASDGNNGHWLLIIGIALSLLSLAGFGYLIFAAVSRRKKTAPVQTSTAKSAPAAKSGGRYRENDDYDDDYSTGEKHVKSKTKSDKPKNGTRYK